MDLPLLLGAGTCCDPCRGLHAWPLVEGNSFCQPHGQPVITGDWDEGVLLAHQPLRCVLVFCRAHELELPSKAG